MPAEHVLPGLCDRAAPAARLGERTDQLVTDAHIVGVAEIVLQPFQPPGEQPGLSGGRTDRPGPRWRNAASSARCAAGAAVSGDCSAKPRLRRCATLPAAVEHLPGKLADRPPELRRLAGLGASRSSRTSATGAASVRYNALCARRDAPRGRPSGGGVLWRGSARRYRSNRRALPWAGTISSRSKTSRLRAVPSSSDSQCSSAEAQRRLLVRQHLTERRQHRAQAAHADAHLVNALGGRRPPPPPRCAGSARGKQSRCAAKPRRRSAWGRA